jgi:pimeloyl-ACP methyl ester carboxylesterase
MTVGVVDGFLAASDGTRIAYRDHGGTGRGLVLLHGGGANLESMDQYAVRLGASRRTVAIDLRACGQSDDPPHFTLMDAAGDVGLVVEQLRMGPVDVVGHSMGGFVAGFYGTANPDARIVSIDGFGPGMVTVGSTADRIEFRAFQDQMRAAFFEMTSGPDTGDRAWRDEQVDLLTELSRAWATPRRMPGRWRSGTSSKTGTGSSGGAHRGTCSPTPSPTTETSTSCGCTETSDVRR